MEIIRCYWGEYNHAYVDFKVYGTRYRARTKTPQDRTGGRFHGRTSCIQWNVFHDNKWSPMFWFFGYGPGQDVSPDGGDQITKAFEEWAKNPPVIVSKKEKAQSLLDRFIVYTGGLILKVI